VRAVCTGDWHAGVAALDLAEQERVWHRIVDVAIENDVDLFLHGGDLFEGPLTTPEQMRAVLNPLARLHYSQIPVILLLGNGRHDLAARPVHGLDVLREIPGIQVSDRPENIQVAGCVVSTLPWTKRARDEDTATQLVQIARGLHEEANGFPNVLLAHWSISSGSLPNGLPLTELREPVLEWAELDAIGFDVIVAAHIHRYQELHDPALGDETPGCYVGSPQPLSHGEGAYEHGVVLLEIE